MTADYRKRVLVAGDTTVDWHIVFNQEVKADAPGWRQQDSSHIVVRLGGAMLVRDLLMNLADDVDVVPAPHLDGEEPPGQGTVLTPTDPRYNHATAVWAPFPRTTDDKDKDDLVWRIREVQGIVRATSPADTVTALPQPPSAGVNIDAVVIDDAGLSAREEDAFWQEIHPAVCPEAACATPPWVLLKTSWPVGRGALLKRLLEACGSRLLVLTTANDLRSSEFRISEGLSWEASAQDLTWEMAYNPALSYLRRAACVVVSFGPSGIWMSRRSLGGGGSAAQIDPLLVFDPHHLEGDWEAHRPGMLIGYMSTLTACFAKRLLERRDGINLVQTAEISLNCMRALHEAGFRFDQRVKGVTLPNEAIRTAYSALSAYGQTCVPIPVRTYTVPGVLAPPAPERPWSILRDNYPQWDSLLALAEDIVVQGPKAVLKKVPVAQFGYLTAVDRREVESFRSVHGLIKEYIAGPDTGSPLSIGVFGPPGSGKSFGVTQIANAVAGDGHIKKLTFNLSQFDDPGRLLQAFHLLRDCNLSGRIPLVFWDEFDSTIRQQPLFWLKYFLAPMQDGEFMEGQVMHPIGKAIFVFAGGTAPHLLALGADLKRQPNGDTLWREVKGPDFVSRLKGYINIVGIDRSEGEAGSSSTVPDSEHVVRRAIVLRSVLERQASNVIGTDKRADIDHGLLRAFLQVWRYRHGARSLEAIVSMSKLQGARSFQPSALPPQLLLELHVNAREFLGIYNQRVEFDGEELERLAEANHDVYLSTTPNPNGIPPYAGLDEVQKKKNRDAVRAWPHMLASIGYTFVSEVELKPTDERVDQIPPSKVEYLAKLEHDRWVIREVANGTVFDEKKSNELPRRSPYLVPWTAMTPEGLREVYPTEVATRMGLGPLKDPSFDLAMIEHIPQVLKAASLVLVRTAPEGPNGTH